jgi:Ser/Thr protein kinase RdoA (MazF antagonist)
VSEGEPLSHPFAALTPDVVLDAAERLGVHCDGRLLELNSFENRVFRVGVDDGPPLIVKFYRPQRFSPAAIGEEHAFLAELKGAELPVAAPLGEPSLMPIDVPGATFLVALFPCLPGRAVDLESKDHLAWLGRLLARMHLIGARSRFRHRATLSAQQADAALNAILQGPLCPPSLLTRAADVGSALGDRIRARFDAVGPTATIRLHGDLHRGNLLWNEGPLLVDFDDAVNGPAVQDLWMLLPDDGDSAARDALLEGYETFRPFERTELALIPALRALRRLHFAGWLSQRYNDPAFPRAFPYAASARFWEDDIIEWQQLLRDEDS